MLKDGVINYGITTMQLQKQYIKMTLFCLSWINYKYIQEQYMRVHICIMRCIPYYYKFRQHIYYYIFFFFVIIITTITYTHGIIKFLTYLILSICVTTVI